MKKSSWGLAVAFTALVGASAAWAADIPRGPSPYYSSPVIPANSVYNWAGFYAGANVGYEWGKITNSPLRPSGIAGGIQGGYNRQNGRFVFGGETDIQASAADDTFAPYKFSNPWFGTVRARVGYAFSNILLYGTAGLAYGDVTATTPLGLDESKTSLGWTAGLGVEVGFAPNWSAKVEYLYLDLGDENYVTTGTDNGLGASVLRFGVNYHF